MWNSLRHGPGGPALIFGSVLLLIATAFVSIGPAVFGQDPLSQDLLQALAAPSLDHPLGTDELGRDILARLMEGGRRSLVIGVLAGLVAFVLGVPIGLVSGYAGGWTDSISMRTMDFLLALPSILVALTIIVVFGRGDVAALIAITIVSIPEFARLARAETFRLRNQEFVLAVRLAGGGHVRTLRTILRNGSAPLAVQLMITITLAILLEAGLSFLGLGPPPPQPSWGQMLRSAQQYLYETPIYAMAPGLALTFVTVGLEAVGRGLRLRLADRVGAVDMVASKPSGAR